MRQDDDGVDVVIAERDGGGRRTLRADYVVGCDGSRSVTRAQAGITQTLSDHDRLMVLLVFRSHELHRLLERYPGKSFYSVLHPELEGYWKFFGRVDLGSTWFFHAPVPPGTTRDNFDFRAACSCRRRRGVRHRVRAHRLLGAALRRRRHLSPGAHLHRRRCGPQPSALRRLRHQHRPRGRAQPRLEARRRAAGLGGRRLARRLRRGAAARVPVDRARLHREGHRGRPRIPGSVRSRARQGGVRARMGARKSGARSEVNAFEPNYEGSPIVCGPPGGRCSARRLARLRSARRPPPGAPAALVGAQRVRGAGRRLHAPRSRRRRHSVPCLRRLPPMRCTSR